MSQPLPGSAGPHPPADPAELVETHNAPADVVQTIDDEIAAVPPLPVTVTDPARVILMPAKSSGWTQIPLTTTAAVKILDRDPRRKRAVLSLFDTGGTSDGAVLGSTQAEAGSPYGFLLPLMGPNIAAGNVASAAMMEITAVDEVWAQAQAAACIVSIYNEQWSD